MQTHVTKAPAGNGSTAHVPKMAQVAPFSSDPFDILRRSLDRETMAQEQATIAAHLARLTGIEPASAVQP